MWNDFEFWNKSNPYISMGKETLKWMLNYYDCEQTAKFSFYVHGERENKCKTYEDWKEFLRSIAINWQSNWDKFDYSMRDLCEWQNFFRTYGKKYGLLKEFHENGIC